MSYVLIGSPLKQLDTSPFMPPDLVLMGGLVEPTGNFGLTGVMRRQGRRGMSEDET